MRAVQVAAPDAIGFGENEARPSTCVTNHTRRDYDTRKLAEAKRGKKAVADRS